MIVEVGMTDDLLLTDAFVTLLAVKGLDANGDGPRIRILAWGVYPLNNYSAGAVGTLTARLNRWSSGKTTSGGTTAVTQKTDPDDPKAISDYMAAVENTGTPIVLAGAPSVEVLKSVNVPVDSFYEMTYSGGQQPVLTTEELVSVEMKMQTGDGTVSARGFVRLGVE